MTDQRRLRMGIGGIRCLRPRFGQDSTMVACANYPWYLRPGDVIRCRCGATTCADSFKPGETAYWLPTGDGGTDT